MIGQLRSEFLKQRSTQTALLLFLAMFVLVALAVAMHVLALGKADLSTHQRQLEVFQVGTRAGMLFAALVGAIAITAEFRYGTIRPTFLVTPSRSPVIVAKLVVCAVFGAAFGLAAELLMTGAAAVGFSARGIPNHLTSLDYTQLLLGGAAAAALWAAIGVGVGAVVRNQVGAVVGLCLWLFLVEAISGSFVPGAARLMPGGAGLALAGNETKLSVAAGIGLLAAYAAVSATAGWVSTLRRGAT